MLILIQEDSGERREFAAELLRIGRVDGNDLVLAVDHISSRHAQIKRRGERYLVTDLGSTNGSCVERGGQRLLLGPRGREEIALEGGDVLVLGDIDRPERWRVELRADAPPAGDTIVARRDSDATQAALRLGDHARVLPALLAVVEELAASDSAQQLLFAVARAAAGAISGAADVLVVGPPPDGSAGSLEVLARAQGPQGGICSEPADVLCRHALARGEALLFGQASAELPAQTLVARGLASGIAAPIGEPPRAVLQINCKGRGQPQGLDEQALDLAVVLAHHAAVALQKAELVERLREAERSLREENIFLRRRAAGASAVVAESPQMRALMAELDKAAESDVTVLLSGETGTGKEVAAQRIHQRSRRADELLVPVNCGALADNLLDSELFGHKKGAFTGAQSDRKGVFEVASGGTVFLDEIGETPLDLQVRLLRVLQEGKIKRVGEVMERSVDVRIIAATNRDLAQLVEQGRFRQDLYYRLRVFPLRLPPLRERQGDIAPLCTHFVTHFAAQLGKPVGALDPALAEVLEGYPFPGNIRELANELERAVVRAEAGESIGPELLSEELLSAARPTPKTAAPVLGATLKEQLDAYERELIRAALERNGGRKAATAAELGLTRQGLAKKIGRLGL